MGTLSGGDSASRRNYGEGNMSGLPDEPLRKGALVCPYAPYCVMSHEAIRCARPNTLSKEHRRVIDRASRMLEAVPLANVETATCRDALIRHWIGRFGVPAHLTSDQGAQFTSSLWARTCEANVEVDTESEWGRGSMMNECVSISCKIRRKGRMSLVAEDRAIYSLSVVERAISDWTLLVQDTGQPQKVIT